MKKLSNPCLFLFLSLIISGCNFTPFYIVALDEEAIVTQDDQIIGDPKEPGLHIKIPFIQKVHIIKVKRIIELRLPVLNLTDTEVILMWSVNNSKQYFLATQRGENPRLAEKILSDEFNKVIHSVNSKTIAQIIKAQDKDPLYSGDEIMKVREHFQKSVANFGIEIYNIHFKADEIRQ